MKARIVTHLATAGLLLAVLTGTSAHAQIAQYDAALHDQFGFNFGDMTTTTTGGVLNILATGFGGSGSDLTNPITETNFDFNTAQLEVTLTVNTANVADNLRIVLIDRDSVAPLTGEEYQFFVSLVGVTPGVQTTLIQDLSGPVFSQAINGGAIGDGVQSYGLTQIQIQSEFGSTNVLDVAVESVKITPEPGTAALAAAGAGLIALRRRRA